jgi:hypothetical protein
MDQYQKLLNAVNTEIPEKKTSIKSSHTGSQNSLEKMKKTYIKSFLDILFNSFPIVLHVIHRNRIFSIIYHQQI